MTVFPSIINETRTNRGNRAFAVDISFTWQVEVSRLREYVAAENEYHVNINITNSIYFSGTIVETGDLVGLTPEGNVPAQYNGRLLTSDATVLVPEIFKKAPPGSVVPGAPAPTQTETPSPTPAPTPAPDPTPTPTPDPTPAPTPDPTPDPGY